MSTRNLKHTHTQRGDQKIKVCCTYVSLKKAIRTENSSLTKEVQDLKAKQNDQVIY